MLSRILSLLFALVQLFLWAHHPHTEQTEQAAIERAKTLKVSSLDGNLPNVMLEFFLKYEGEGAPIEWRIGNCDTAEGNRVTDGQRDSTICVEAEVYLKDGRAARIVISLPRSEGRPVRVPAVFSIVGTDQSGSARNLRRLGDLPMALHRRAPKSPKSPRDLPLPVGSVRWPLAGEAVLICKLLCFG